MLSDELRDRLTEPNKPLSSSEEHEFGLSLADLARTTLDIDRTTAFRNPDYNPVGDYDGITYVDYPNLLLAEAVHGYVPKVAERIIGLRSVDWKARKKMGEIQRELIESRDLFFVKNRGLIYRMMDKMHVSGKHFSKGEDGSSDYRSLGDEALLKAYMKFDWAYGGKFSSYACLVIKNKFLRHMEKEKIRKKLTPFNLKISNLDETRSVHLDIEDRYHEYLNPAKYVAIQELRDKMPLKLGDALAKLPEKTATIIRRYVGMDGWDAQNFPTIGRTIGVGKSNVAKHFNRGIEMLREILAGEGLEMLLE